PLRARAGGDDPDRSDVARERPTGALERFQERLLLAQPERRAAARAVGAPLRAKRVAAALDLHAARGVVFRKIDGRLLKREKDRGDHEVLRSTVHSTVDARRASPELFLKKMVAAIVLGSERDIIFPY